MILIITHTTHAAHATYVTLVPHPSTLSVIILSRGRNPILLDSRKVLFHGFKDILKSILLIFPHFLDLLVQRFEIRNIVLHLLEFFVVGG